MDPISCQIICFGKNLLYFRTEKNDGPLFEIDRKLVPYRPERRRRHHHHHRCHRRRNAAAAGCGGGIACYKNTNNYNYPFFRNTLKGRRHPRNKTHNRAI